MALYADRVALIDTENAFKVGPHVLKAEQAGTRVIRCNVGEPDFAVPQPIRDEVKRNLDLDNTHYADPQGTLSLRQAIADRYNGMHGLSTTAAHVVAFPGGKPAIGLCQTVYCQPTFIYN